MLNFIYIGIADLWGTGSKRTIKNENTSRCLWNTNAPFLNIARIGFTFDLDLLPTDLNINRNDLLIKDYLPTEFEASGAKRSWVISCARCGSPRRPFDLDHWPSDLNIYRDRLLMKDYLPTKFESFWGKAILNYQLHKVWETKMTFDLLTWISIGVIYSSRTIYLQSLKLLGQILLELSVAQG